MVFVIHSEADIAHLKSAKGKRRDWKKKLPPKPYRIRILDAIEVAGNANKLALALGITRSAVYQWRPPYRYDPYLPKKAAMKFMGIRDLRERYQDLQWKLK